MFLNKYLFFIETLTCALRAQVSMILNIMLEVGIELLTSLSLLSFTPLLQPSSYLGFFSREIYRGQNLLYSLDRLLCELIRENKMMI